MTKVVITAVGAISSIGVNVEEISSSITKSIHGISPVSILKSKLRGQVLAGEVKYSNEQLAAMTGLSGLQSRTTLLAGIALKELISTSGIDGEMINNTGFISSTTVGGMDQSENFYNDFLIGENIEYSKVHLSGQHTRCLVDHFGFQSYNSTISTACSSSLNALIIGSRLIKSNKMERVVIGGADSLSKFTLNGFKSLMILNQDHCTPFDKDRKGLNLGEGAAYLLLENKESAVRRGAKILAEVKGYSNVNEAYHQTASSPNGEGAFQAMSKALKMADLSPENIDYLNAHGTGTDNNDNSESIAINRLFASKQNLNYSSTKAFTGHTLAASGSIESVISILALNKGVIPPNLNFKNGIDGAVILPAFEKIEGVLIKNVLSNSFGFGGNNTSVIFSKP